MKKLFFAVAMLSTTFAFSMGDKIDLGDNQVAVRASGSARGPKSGMACQQAEKMADANLVNACSALGRNARLISQEDTHCSCFEDGNFFEKCSAGAYGICQID